MTSTAIAMRGGAVDQAQPAKPDRTSATLEALRRQKRLEEVFSTAAAIWKATEGDGQPHQWGWSWLREAMSRPPTAGTFSGLVAARSWLEAVPDTEAIRTGVDEIGAALATPIDERTAGFLVGLTLDSIPSAGRQVREGYLAALIFHLVESGHSPHAVARACSIAVKRQTFLPSVAEVLEQAEEWTRTLRLAHDHGCQLLAMHAACTAVLAAWDRGPDLWSDVEWCALAREWRNHHSGGDYDARPWPAHLGPPPHRTGTRFPAHLRSGLDFPPLDAEATA